MPEITTACFHELHAGKLATSITGKYRSVLIHIDTEFEKFLFVVTKEAERSRILLSRISKNYAPACAISIAGNNHF